MYRRILVPLDGSVQAEAAVPYAAGLPCEQVRLLMVRPPDADDDAAEGAPPEALLRARAMFENAGRAAEPMVERGDPAEQIVRVAATAELIVMTTRGLGAGGRLVYGSVADRVARHAPVPTLIVRAGDDPVDPAPLARVVVPLDGSETAARALPVAEGLARLVGVPVHCVAVAEVEGVSGAVAPRLPEGVYQAARQAARARAEERIEHAVNELRAAGMDASGEVREGSARSELIAALRAGDLVVMTTHGHGRATRWSIGTVAERVLHRSPGPVLLIRADLAPSS